MIFVKHVGADAFVRPKRSEYRIQPQRTPWIV